MGQVLAIDKGQVDIFSSNILISKTRAKHSIENPREILRKEWVRDCGNDLQRGRPGTHKSGGTENALW